ncbi:hypothetical protein VKT23_015636 [Stygiomarasmius scandens]|uniref:Uncharacterized protein n=1 Tax=Marasmiellus scandens TaxID=2682957 RepID=A0ABR1J1A3_9AGAR
MSSTVDSQSNSANVESFNHSSSSFSQSKVNTIGRDLHETHHHYHAVEGSNSWPVRARSGVLGRLWSSIVENFSEFGSTERVPREAIEVLDELHGRENYRVHSARLNQRFAVVKVYHGRRAKESFKKAVKLYKCLLHPSIIRMIAVSSRTCDAPFIVFDSNCETGSVEANIASALTAGLPRSVRLGFQIVGGISAALDYLAANDLPLGSLGPDSFEVYITHEDQVKIGIDSNEQVEKISFDKDDADVLWELLDTLCDRTFRDANRLLYNDERCEEEEFSVSERLESRRSNIEPPNPTMLLSSSSESSSVASPSFSALRRELSWRRSQRGSKTISSVARQYKDRLRLNAGHPYGDSLQLRRLRGGPRRRPIRHRCQGYGREQITLTSNIEDAVLILHSSPSPGEKCLVCGEVVIEEESFQCVCGHADDGFSSTIKCSVCRLWQHRQCAAQNADLRNFVCSFCDPRLQHRYSQEDIGKFKCRLCSKLFKSAFFVKQHIQKRHPEFMNKTATPEALSEEYTSSPTLKFKSSRQRFSACGACRMRRVQCDRKDATSPNSACSNCKERGLKCVDEFADVHHSYRGPTADMMQDFDLSRVPPLALKGINELPSYGGAVAGHAQFHSPPQPLLQSSSAFTFPIANSHNHRVSQGQLQGSHWQPDYQHGSFTTHSTAGKVNSTPIYDSKMSFTSGGPVSFSSDVVMVYGDENLLNAADKLRDAWSYVG